VSIRKKDLFQGHKARHKEEKATRSLIPPWPVFAGKKRGGYRGLFGGESRGRREIGKLYLRQLQFP